MLNIYFPFAKTNINFCIVIVFFIFSSCATPIKAEPSSEAIPNSESETQPPQKQVDAEEKTVILLNYLAWKVATDPNSNKDQITQAILFAKSANNITGNSNDEVLDTLAVALARSGDFESAIKTIERAIELDLDADNKRDYQDRLALFKSKKIYTELNTDPIPSEANPETLSTDQVNLAIEKARRGNAEAQWELALHYLSNGISNDHGIENPGKHWLLEAGKNGHAFAEDELAYAFTHGEYGFAMSVDDAKYWLQFGVKRNSENAIFNMATLLKGTAFTHEEEAEVNAWLLKAARAGFNAAKAELAGRIAEGIGGDANASMQQKFLMELENTRYSTADYIDDEISSLIGMQALVTEQDVSHAELPEFLFALSGLLDAIYRNTELDNIHIPVYENQVIIPNVAYWTLTAVTTSANLGYPYSQYILAAYHSEKKSPNSARNEALYWEKRAHENAMRQEATYFSPKTLEFLFDLLAQYEELHPHQSFDVALEWIKHFEEKPGVENK